MNNKPTLFGLNKTNRDYTKEATWGKNQFNSSFPASLCCYYQVFNLYLKKRDSKYYSWWWSKYA
jgi:hypothetical protein